MEKKPAHIINDWKLNQKVIGLETESDVFT